MNILLKKGICPEGDCPYGQTEISATATNNALKHVITGYAAVFALDELKTALNTDGPCVIVFPVYKYDNQFWKAATREQQPIGYHAVTVCGYDTYGFIIRNSWGPNWNNGGYTTYSYADWGAHLEIWSSVSLSPKPEPKTEPEPNKNLVKRCCVVM